MYWLIEQISSQTSVWIAMIITGVLLGFGLLFWLWLFRSAHNLKITATKRSAGVLLTIFFLSQTIGFNHHNFFKLSRNKENIALNQTKQNAPKLQEKNNKTKIAANNKKRETNKKQKEQQQAEAQAAKNAEEQLRLFNEQVKQQLNKQNKD